MNMLFKQLFLLAEDAMSIWQLQEEQFCFLDANEKAKKEKEATPHNIWQEWFSENEIQRLEALGKKALIIQERLQLNSSQTQFTVIPLSSDTIAISEKKETSLFPFFTSSSELMMKLSEEQMILDHSPSYETLTGFSREDLNGKSLAEFIHQDDLKKVHKAFKKAWKNKTPIIEEWRMWSINDTYLSVETSFSPMFDEQHEVISILLVGRDISKRKEQEEKLYHLAFHDPLTELPNRRLFNEQLKQTIYHYERKKLPFAIFLLDCDHFKNINDTYGHDIGDEIIKGFAQRVKSLIRKSDILSRFGGDEFALLLPEVRSKEDVQQIAKRIIEKIQEPWIFDDHIVETTTSVGVFFVDEHTPDVSFENALKNADIALYEAKNNGKNHFQLFEVHRTANE